MPVTTTVTLNSKGVGAGTVPTGGNHMRVVLPVGFRPRVGLAIIYQEATPSGEAYFGFDTNVTAVGDGTATDGVPVLDKAGAIPAETLERGISDVYLTAKTGAVPVSFLLS